MTIDEQTKTFAALLLLGALGLNSCAADPARAELVRVAALQVLDDEYRDVLAGCEMATVPDVEDCAARALLVAFDAVDSDMGRHAYHAARAFLLDTFRGFCIGAEFAAGMMNAAAAPVPAGRVN